MNDIMGRFFLLVRWVLVLVVGLPLTIVNLALLFSLGLWLYSSPAGLTGNHRLSGDYFLLRHDESSTCIR